MKYIYLMMLFLLFTACACAGTPRDPFHETAYPEPIIQQTDHFQ